MLQCIIQDFEYTFYHILLFMATIPHVMILAPRGYAAVC
jgi:hypothetical protein